ncbi:MAG TPA: COX15/CtaA family protein, partial [Ferruginibacter sp.]|nr:COX15/CtaA family protein [Ferruginibacter sp.]
WEWFHRLWARLIGVVFIIGFVYFIWKRKFDRSMIRPLLVLFVLGALQGAIGWMMVKSGLVPEMYFVGHVELTTHFLAALLLLAATLWYALSMLPAFDAKLENASIRNRLYWIAGILLLQLMYGGFMAGMKAGAVAPTWPSINGSWLPAAQMHEMGSLSKDLFQNKIMVQFVHRALAYLLCLLIVWFYFRSANTRHARFNRWRTILFSLIIVQLMLGIFTVLNATDATQLVWLGVAHQFTAMLLLMTVTILLFLVRSPKAATAS